MGRKIIIERSGRGKVSVSKDELRVSSDMVDAVFADPKSLEHEEIKGVAGSVFGPDESERRIQGLLEEHDGDRAKALSSFIIAEVAERVAGEEKPPTYLSDDWGSARTLIMPAGERRGFPYAEKDIVSGHDARSIIDNLENARLLDEDSVGKCETLVKIYIEARKRLFPEAPEVPFPGE